MEPLLEKVSNDADFNEGFAFLHGYENKRKT